MRCAAVVGGLALAIVTPGAAAVEADLAEPRDASQGSPEVRFVSPPNGARDVARFPVLTARFSGRVPAGGRELEALIELRDRTGQRVPLRVWRSSGREDVLIATPRSRDHRLEPAEDYLLAVGDAAAGERLTTRFQTGGLKSVFCVARARAGAPWQNSCPETYWRDDPAVGLERCEAPAGVDPGSNPCRCDVVGSELEGAGEPVLGGRRPLCLCTEEAALAEAPPDFPVVIGVEPGPGGWWDPERTSLELTLDRELASPERYYLQILDITDPAQPPRAVLSANPDYTDGRFVLRVSPPERNRRYRVQLGVRGRRVPDVGLRSAEPYGFSWTFHTWDGPGGALLRMVPSPQSPPIGLPTHLPTRPHLRFEFDAPVLRGMADVDGPPLELVRHDGARAVAGVASWIDVDPRRLHLLASGALDPGERYTVRCSDDFLRRQGDPGWCDRLGWFLVQPAVPVQPAPLSGEPAFTRDVRYGERGALERARGERWLPLRPTVSNGAYGLRERYAVDASGEPASFLGHVVVVPEPPPSAHRIRVDPRDPACRPLRAQALDAMRRRPDYVASTRSCGECSDGRVCRACPAGGGPGCPQGESRCRVDEAAYRSELTAFCRDVVSTGTPACALQDAVRCVSGGVYDERHAAGQMRMSAGEASGCPRGYAYSPTHDCVPSGPVTLELAGGEHRGGFYVSGRGAQHLDPVAGRLVEGNPPVVLTGTPGEPPPVLSPMLPLPAGGFEVRGDVCLTSGREPVYRCALETGVCGPSTGYRCVPFQRGASSKDACSARGGFSWDASLRVCRADPALPGSPFVAGGAPAELRRIEWRERSDLGPGLWELPWPQRRDGRELDFMARAAPVEEPADFGPLPVVPLLPSYEACDRALDPGSCARRVCAEWNEKSEEQQLEAYLDLLRADAGPLAYFAGGSITRQRACERLGTIQARDRRPRSGPRALVLKLPQGLTPARLRIEGVDGTPGPGAYPRPLRLEGVQDWTFQGLVFDGFAGEILVSGGRRLRVVGNQLWRSTFDLAGVDGFTFRGNLSLGAPMANAVLDAPVGYRIQENVALDVQAKTYTLAWSRDARIDPTRPPEVCTPEQGADCTLPTCRLDRECRIPFAFEEPGQAAQIGLDPTRPGAFPRCERPAGQELGQCSHGIRGGGLFSDNLLLGTWGIHGGPGYALRVQRNHFENLTVGKIWDTRFKGLSYSWILDNVLFNSGDNAVVLDSLRFPEREADAPRFAQAISFEGNLVARNGRAWITQRNRDGKNHPGRGRSTGALAYVGESARPERDVRRGLRIVDNTVYRGPGARELDDGAACGVRVAGMSDVEISHNTLIGDCPTPLSVEAPRGRAAPTGRVAANLVLPTRRTSYPEVLCTERGAADLVAARGDGLAVQGNASVRPDEALGRRAAAVRLGADPWTALLHEPVPFSPVIDAETYQRRLVAREEQEAARYARWPGYDPGLLDDVLRPRPGSLACELGARTERACADPDVDRDGYVCTAERCRDNCPERPNPDQRDRDADGLGDACDP